MVHRKFIFLIATCLVCLARQQPPTFRTTTSLVEVSVVALDAKGDPVTDLKKEEIALTDKGREKELAFFRFEGAPEATSPKPLPPGVFTNRTELTQGPPRNICAIVIDTLNTPATNQAWARSQAMRCLRTVAPATRVGLYVMGQKMTALQDFTDDVEALRERIANGSMQSQPQLEVNMDASVRDAEQLLDSIAPGRREMAQGVLGASARSSSR
jgi:VWFA-related protein